MKIYNEHVTLQSKKPREVFNITTRVKAAMEKSGFRDGVILVSSLHSNSGVIVNEEEPRSFRFWTIGCTNLRPAEKISNSRKGLKVARMTRPFICKACCCITRSWCLSPRRASILDSGKPYFSLSSMACARGASSSK